MVLDVIVPIPVKIVVDDADPRRCGACAYKRADRCALFRSAVVANTRCAACVFNVPVASAPAESAFAHIQQPQRFSLGQIQDIVAAGDSTPDIRRVLTTKWTTVDKIQPRSSFSAADSDTRGYGPTDAHGFFHYSV